MAEKNYLKATILTISEYSALQKNAVIKLYDKRCVTWKNYKNITSILKKKFISLLATLPDVGNNSESYVFIVFKNEKNSGGRGFGAMDPSKRRSGSTGQIYSCI